MEFQLCNVSVDRIMLPFKFISGCCFESTNWMMDELVSVTCLVCGSF